MVKIYVWIHGPIGWSINAEDDFEIGGSGQNKPIMGLQLYSMYSFSTSIEELLVSYCI